MIRPAARLAPLRPQHDLRHSCAALLIELGRAIQERLGHSSITVTMDVYGHLFPAINEGLTDRLDEIFQAARVHPGGPSSGVMLALPAP
jgi:integrase